MRIKTMLSITLLISLSVFTGFSQNQEEKNPNLLSLGDSDYSLNEFDYYFLKNTEKPSAEDAKSAVNEYLDLFINFKLKVTEAIALKMDEDPAFVQEFDGYKAQLIEPFLSTSEANEKLLEEAYDRLKWEIAGTHILIAPKDAMNPEDTLKTFNQLLDLKKRIEQGEDMNELAKQYSTDRSAENNGGYLGYFTSMQMVYPFENAAYGGEVGEIVGPFKTRFGYHIIRIDDKRPARGQAKVAHIMIRYTADSLDQNRAEQKAASIYDMLQDGKDWDELCKLYSDDKNTSSKGGEMNWFGTGQLVPEFEDVTFALDSIGSISEPVKTRFGWHIIKLLGKKPLASFDEQRADIEKRISKDSRTQVKKSKALSIIKTKYQYSIDSTNLKSAYNGMDESLLTGKWRADSSSLDAAKAIFTLGTKQYTVGDFWMYAQENQQIRKTTPLVDYRKSLYNRFEETSIFDYEKDFIQNNNTEYRMILDEYKSGILLFNLMEEKVWNRAIKDTTGLKEFYQKNQSSYKKAPHVVTRKLVLSDSTLIDSLQHQLSLSNSQLDSLFNAAEPLTLQASDAVVFKGDNAFLDAHWQAGVFVEASNDFCTVWSVEEVNNKGFKAMNEIKGTVISDYQQVLEEEWIKSLKKKYPVKVNKGELKNYINSFE